MNLQNRLNGKVHTISEDQVFTVTDGEQTGRICREGAKTTCGTKITGDRMEWTNDEATCGRCNRNLA